jgi:hypothetical protein
MAPTWPSAPVGGLHTLTEESARLHQHSSPSQSTGDRVEKGRGEGDRESKGGKDV